VTEARALVSFHFTAGRVEVKIWIGYILLHRAEIRDWRLEILVRVELSQYDLANIAIRNRFSQFVTLLYSPQVVTPPWEGFLLSVQHQDLERRDTTLSRTKREVYGRSKSSSDKTQL
jgi:hypothetical protein